MIAGWGPADEASNRPPPGVEQLRRETRPATIEAAVAHVEEVGVVALADAIVLLIPARLAGLVACGAGHEGGTSWLGVIEASVVDPVMAACRRRNLKLKADTPRIRVASFDLDFDGRAKIVQVWLACAGCGEPL